MPLVEYVRRWKIGAQHSPSTRIHVYKYIRRAIFHWHGRTSSSAPGRATGGLPWGLEQRETIGLYARSSLRKEKSDETTAVAAAAYMLSASHQACPP